MSEATSRAPEGSGGTLASPALLARGTLVSALALAVAGLGALFPFFVARLLGEAALGAYAVAWAYADLLSKVGTFGLDQTAVAVVARRRAEGDLAGVGAVVRKALLSGLGLSVLVAAAAWVAFGAGEWGSAPELLDARRLMLLALPGVALYRISNGVSRGLGIMGHDVFSGGLAENLVAVAALLLLVAAGGASWLGAGRVPVLAGVAGFTAGGLVALVLAARAVRRLTRDAGPGRAPGLLRLAATVAGAGLLNLLVNRLDVLVLGAFVGRAPGLTAATLGVYCAAVEVAGVTRKVRQAVEAPFLHAVATAAGRGRAAAGGEEAAQGGRWVLAALLLLGGTLAAGATAVLSLFGPGFVAGAGWLAVLLLAHALGSYSGLAENVLLVRRPALNLANALVSSVAYLGTAVALVPRLGALGGALSALLALALLALLRFAELRFLLEEPWPWARMRGTLAAFALALPLPAALATVSRGTAASAGAALLFALAFAALWWRLGREQADAAVLRAAWPGRRRLG